MANGNGVSSEEQEWLAGQSVKITGTTEHAELLGRCGTIMDADLSGNGLLSVRMHMPNMEHKMVSVAPSALELDTDEPHVQVMWTYIRRLNTGKHGELGVAMADAYAMDTDEESALRQIDCSISELHVFIERMQFARRPATLLKRLGLNVACFAHPFEASDQGQGRDNVLASHLAMGEDGCATPVIVGTAFFVRLSGTTGEVMDLKHDDAIRTLMFLNDTTTLLKGVEGGGLSSDVWQTLTACFPYYDEGCLMRKNGFTGMRSMTRQEDGSFLKEPENMERTLSAG